MRHRRTGVRLAWLAAFFALLINCYRAVAAPPEERVPRELIVHFSDAERATQTLGTQRRVSHGVQVVVLDTDHRAERTERWRHLHQAMDEWRRRPGVRWVEPNYYGRFDGVAEAAPPDDPEFSKQWWLPAVGAQGLWPIGQGRGVRIAVVDSGVSLTHPDLAANLENDGYDFGDNDADPNDGLGHGTGVAGVIAALANNGVGIAGLAPATRLLPVKVSEQATDRFTATTVAQAINYAVDKGVQIINLSLTFGLDQATELLRQSVQDALDRGVVVVAAAGNFGSEVQFPASMPGVIAVAGTDLQGALKSTSNRGPEIAIAAPGTDILTASPNAGYTSRSGTSFAAPMVSGAIAALMSVNPSLPTSTLLSLLRSTATPITGQTFGQLHAARAAVGLLPGIALHAGPWTTQRSLEAAYYLPPSGSPIDIYVAATTPAGEFSLLPDCTWASAAASGYTPVAIGYRAAGAASGVMFGPGGACASIPLAGLTPGIYDLRVAATIGGNLLGAVNSEAFDIVP